MARFRSLVLVALACGCADVRSSSPSGASFGDTGSGPDPGPSASDTGDTSAAADDAAESSAGSEPIFDVGDDDTGGPAPDRCAVADEMDGVGPCRVQAPADAFDPVTQWIWPAEDPGEGGLRFVYTAPLVANLTDDDGNGSIDLCDVPDVVVIAFRDWIGSQTPGSLVVLDGATGAEHFVIEDVAGASVTPALGDIDGDGLVEIVTIATDRGLVAFEHDGSVAWHVPPVQYADPFHSYGMAVALADLDADGDVEIIAGAKVFDHLGHELWTMPSFVGGANVRNTIWTAHTAADLDDDGQLEVIAGHSAWRHDGTPYYDHAEWFVFSPNPDVTSPSVHTLPQVADVDDDPEPEIVVLAQTGMSVLEHDGSAKFLDSTPIDPLTPGDSLTPWFRPATIHNLDDDEDVEVAVSSADHYSAFDILAGGASVVWSSPVDDWSGSAAGTAFDFLGDGTAEAMYGDQNTMWVFDANGAPLLEFPRSSGTIIEYPTVADVDNDGSAELLIPSDYYMADAAPGLRVVRDAEDRWIPARRIWNQHTYHVTNVREDGTIPQHEPKHWEQLNTFRTQAQLEGGGVCNPRPEG